MVGCSLLHLRSRTCRLGRVASFLRQRLSSTYTLDCGVAAAESLRRSGSGILRGWHDGGTDHGVVENPIFESDFAYLGDGVQGHEETSATNCARVGGGR